MFYAYYFNSTYYQRTLSQSVAPQFSHSYQPLYLSVDPHFSHFERTSSVSVVPQFYCYSSTINGDFDNCKPTLHEQPLLDKLHDDAISDLEKKKFGLKQKADRVLESASMSKLNPNAEPFISQKSRSPAEFNSPLVHQHASTLNPNAKPFVSCSQARFQGSNFDYIRQQQQLQEEKTVLGKRKFGKARKENNDEEPPRKKYCALIKFYFRNPFIPPMTNNVEVAERLRQSKSNVEEQPSICENIMAQDKRASAIGTVKRSSLGPTTIRAKVQKHSGSMARNAKKVVKTATKAAERIKRQENEKHNEIKKREEIQKHKEISRQIDREALKRRKMKAQQLQNLDNDIAARDKFFQSYAERFERIKQKRYAKRIQRKLSQCHSRAIYNNYRNYS